MSSSWQECSSRSTVPSMAPTRSCTAVDALICAPVSGSTRNSSSSTPTVNGAPEPKACWLGSSRAAMPAPYPVG
jgi:hypothetical protein